MAANKEPPNMDLLMANAPAVVDRIFDYLTDLRDKLAVSGVSRKFRQQGDHS